MDQTYSGTHFHLTFSEDVEKMTTRATIGEIAEVLAHGITTSQDLDYESISIRLGVKRSDFSPRLWSITPQGTIDQTQFDQTDTTVYNKLSSDTCIYYLVAEYVTEGQITGYTQDVADLGHVYIGESEAPVAESYTVASTINLFTYDPTGKIFIQKTYDEDADETTLTLYIGVGNYSVVNELTGKVEVDNPTTIFLIIEHIDNCKKDCRKFR